MLYSSPWSGVISYCQQMAVVHDDKTPNLSHFHLSFRDVNGDFMHIVLFSYSYIHTYTLINHLKLFGIHKK